MIRPPELELALILENTGVAPEQIREAMTQGGQILRVSSLVSLFGNDRKKILSILSITQAAGAIKATHATNTPLASREWMPVEGRLNQFLTNASVISLVLPYLKSLYASENSYAISATIPNAFSELEKFYKVFENTALGIRRLIEETRNELLVMIPFIDEIGFTHISESIGDAIKRGISVVLISRYLAEGQRNRIVLSHILAINASNKGKLRLFEAGKNPQLPISHAKIISRDGGEEIYIGSANLTRSSMETTIEVGVFLRGPDSLHVHQFLSEIAENSSCVEI